MKCREVRTRLTGAPAETAGSVEEHLERCEDCSRFAVRLEAARRALRDHHGGVEPDAGFALRVADRLNGQAPELLAWAGARLLPATLVLLAVLGFLAFRALPELAVAEVTSPTDDVLAWVLEEDGGAP